MPDMNSNTPRQITLEHATLETGIELERVVVDYQTWGAPNAEESNVAVVLPALTGTTNAADWWGGIVGPGKYINTDTMFVICPRIRYEAIASIRTNSSPELAKAQPLLTTRDAANIYNCALDAIGIGTIHTIIGGSMGGQMALEWAVQQPHRFANIVIIAANALPSAWGIAIRAAQRSRPYIWYGCTKCRR